MSNITPGFKPNLGRKALPDNMRSITVKLSPNQIAVFNALGDGQTNRGIRKAADLLAIGIGAKNSR